ncbi:probable serine/threonine-protein kinase DDB_G0282963 isoform X2 [Lucilia cuprina]|uniref:probable serine/threonine-protein kinase DDB_G0282963 isoform X2 n=1 Tax=Lucilia cuprina TaxID=7375 RepID=UPI000C71B3BE|nr:probable serine/threonine-protein kinase DDB_G0282963 isoform X2 [Lucilia cuprina]
MLSSSIQQKFQSVITHNFHVSAKPKKRRKRRKKSHRNEALSTSTTTEVLKHKTIAKTKQYFQHDNRLGEKEAKLKQTLFSTSSTFNKYTESDILYGEVAKKFKPLKNTTNKKKSQKTLKAFSKYNTQRKPNAVQKLKRSMPFKTTVSNNNSNPKINKSPTRALSQPQYYICSCQDTESKFYNNNTFLKTKGPAICNDNKNAFTCSTANHTATASGTTHLAIIENNIPKILEFLKSQTPTLLLETLFNNAQLEEYIVKHKRVRDTHQIAEAQLEKNAKLREAFNISEYFVEGSSFDSDRKAKEDLAKSLALQKELDAQREQAAASAANEKESSKRYALVRTPSIERDISSGGMGGGDNDDHINKKKKKKRMRESSASPERKKDKKKKSKKRKKESKSKKSKKLRKRKNSESESNVENDKDSMDEDSDTDSEIDKRKSHKKSKKDKKKRDKKNKKKERSTSPDKSRSRSPVDKLTETKKESLKNENTTKKTSSSNPFRSRSTEKSHKTKETQRSHYESSQENDNRRSHSRKDKDISKCRSHSRTDKEFSRRHSRGHLEKELRHKRHRANSPSDCINRERNEIYYSSSGENRRSRSRQRSRRVDTAERLRDLKRKYSEERLPRKRDSRSIEKRKKYSYSPSQSRSRKSRDNKSYSRTSQRVCYQSRTRSRTPRHKSQDCEQFQVRNDKSRSRSSLNINLHNKSLTPPPLTSKTVDSKGLEKIDYNLNNQGKSDKDLATSSLKDKKNYGRSGTTSSSLSDLASSTDTESSRSRTPSPIKEHLEKPALSRNIEIQKLSSRKTKSPSLRRTPSPTANRSMSRSKSRKLVSEKSTTEKPSRKSRSQESYEQSKEMREDHKKPTSKTPPPSKVEKKPSSPRSSRDSSELSYSPARRNPERYRDILENAKNQKTEKRKPADKDAAKAPMLSEEREKDRREKGGRNDRNPAKPVVRLQSQSEDESDATERNAEKILDEFQESKRERELKDLKMLEQLKSGIAAKAKEKIKTIEKMAAFTSTSSSSNTGGEVSDKSYKRTIRNSLNDFLAANNVAPAVVATCSSTAHSSIQNSPPGAIYPQTLEEIKKEQDTILPNETSSYIENNISNNNKDIETQANCKKSPVAANGHAVLLSPRANPLQNNVNVINKDRDRKRERDHRERERENDRDMKPTRENNNFIKERHMERRQRTSPNIYSTGGSGGCVGSGGVDVGNGGSRRNNNSNLHHINHRHQRLNVNFLGNTGSVGGHHHHHPHPHHHHPNHQIINNHHNTTSSSSAYIANNSSTNPHNLMCNHANNSTNILFNRPSRINNTPLITATQFNNQMLSKQSNSILVNRRDHRTALNLGLSGTPCTNFSNSNLLLTKANTNPHHFHAAAVGHTIGGGHHHHHHHHHHHSQNSSSISGGINPTTQITDRILMAASIAAAQRHSLGVAHSAASSAAAVAAANNLNFLQQQNKAKLVIKPFKINDSQPLVAALADSSLVDAIVSKVSTATVAAAESAARRSRSRSRRSRSRNRREVKTSDAYRSNSAGGGGEREETRRRSNSHSRSSSSSSSRSRSHSRRSSRSRSSQSSSSSRSSSRSSSSSSFGSSRSGTRSPSIPRRRGSPSFLDRRRITSARKRPIPYHRKLPSDVSSCYCSSCCSRDSSPRSRSPSRDSRSPSRNF